MIYICIIHKIFVRENTLHATAISEKPIKCFSLFCINQSLWFQLNVFVNKRNKHNEMYTTFKIKIILLQQLM